MIKNKRLIKHAYTALTEANREYHSQRGANIVQDMKMINGARKDARKSASNKRQELSDLYLIV